MTRPSHWRLWKTLPWLCAASLPAQLAGQSQPTVSGILAEFDRLSEHVVWPGFRASRIPVAIYVRDTTWLVRHPNPPEGFTAHPGRGGLFAMAGRHETMRANTSTMLGGVRTATIQVDPDRNAVAHHYAAVLLHETFHVFQRDEYPHWGGNEVELFVYPMDHAGLLASRKLETAMLRRSLRARDPVSAGCWAARALDFRRERFAQLSDGAVGYERGTELLEGLAEYVEARATGRDAGAILPEADFPADAVRQRSYSVGTALAVLLDRFAPQWMDELDRVRDASLDGVLSAALATRALGSCEASPEDVADAEAWATAAVTDLRARRSAVRARVFTQGGWTVVVESADGAPLFPQNFDPWNVHVVGAGEVVHTRWLQLVNAAGSFEALDLDVLTEGVGSHPLFNGVRRATVAGLTGEPAVERTDSTTVVRGEGLTAQFQHAEIVRQDQTVTVRLRAAH